MRKPWPYVGKWGYNLEDLNALVFINNGDITEYNDYDYSIY